jgi:hypothetical protein
MQLHPQKSDSQWLIAYVWCIIKSKATYQRSHARTVCIVDSYIIVSEFQK